MRTKSMRFKERIFVAFVVCVVLIYLLFAFGSHQLPSIGNIFQFSSFDSHKHNEHDSFADLAAYLRAPRHENQKDFSWFEYVIKENLPPIESPTLSEIINITIDSNNSHTFNFLLSVTANEVYGENDVLLPLVLEELSQRKIERMFHWNVNYTTKRVSIEYPRFVFQFDNTTLGLFRPQKEGRDNQTYPNYFYFQTPERPRSEIAAFHLDKVLGFRKTLPVVGRRVSLLNELVHVSDQEIKSQFYKSDSGKLCFHGICGRKNVCSIFYPYCGTGENMTIEGSVTAMYPDFNNSIVVPIKHPWEREYSLSKLPDWVSDTATCYKAQENNTIYKDGPRLLDLMDMAVFDFLIGNGDRFDYEYFGHFGNYSFPLVLENARGFGNASHDDNLALGPIIQCCLIKEKTLANLLRFHNGPKRLSDAMRESMSSDPLSPVLDESQLKALDRRVGRILHEIRGCIEYTEKNHDTLYAD